MSAETRHPITLPGLPVTFDLSAEDVAVYLLATGWEKEQRDDDVLRFFLPRGYATLHPAHLVPGEPVSTKTIERIAKWESRPALRVARDILARRLGAAPVAELDIDAIEARANAATPGPWRSTWGDDGTAPPKHPDFGEETTIEAVGLEGIDGKVVGLLWYDGLHTACREDDAAFIAAARTDVPALVAEVRRLRAELARRTL